MRCSGYQPMENGTYNLQGPGGNVRVADGQVQVRQGEKILYRRWLRHLGYPLGANHSLHLSADWLAAVNPAGEALRLVITE
jgi:hypothetical protein